MIFFLNMTKSLQYNYVFKLFIHEKNVNRTLGI